MADYGGAAANCADNFSTKLDRGSQVIWSMPMKRIFSPSNMDPNNMDNYKKGRRVIEEIKREEIPIPKLSEDFVWMQITSGNRMRNLLKFAIEGMNDGKQVIWTGTGSTIGKAISCAEILKRKFRAYQITKICYRKVEEYWEPEAPALETIVVKRDVPTIHILISRQPLDPNEPGYQSPDDCRIFIRENANEEEVEVEETNPFRARRRAEFLKILTGQK